MTQDLLQNNASTKFADQKYLKRAHQQIICCLEEVFPPDFNFSVLQKFFQQDHNLSLAQISHGLVQFLVTAIKSNFIHINVYQLLQQQTQKLEASIRKHLKIQQEMKIYIQYLESHNGSQNKKEQKGQNSYEQLKEQIDKITKEKQQLVKHILRIKQQNSVLSSQVEKKNKQVEHYTSMLRTRKKTQQTILGNSILEFKKSLKDDESKINFQSHMKKLKNNIISGKTNFSKSKREIEGGTENHSNYKYQSYLARKTDRNRPNSHSKQPMYRNEQNSSINTTIECLQYSRKNQKISISNEKNNKKYIVKVHKLQQENSLENHVQKKKKCWPTSQLLPPKQRYSVFGSPVQKDSQRNNLLFSEKDNYKPYKYIRTKASDEDIRNYSPQMNYLKNITLKNALYKNKNH